MDAKNTVQPIVIRSHKLSRPYDQRYVVVDKNTKRVLDDANRYGYKTIRNAKTAWNYKNPWNKI